MMLVVKCLWKGSVSEVWSDSFSLQKRAAFLVWNGSSHHGLHPHPVSFNREVRCSKISGLAQRWCVTSTQDWGSGDLHTKLCASAEEWEFSAVQEGITVNLAAWFINLTWRLRCLQICGGNFFQGWHWNRIIRFCRILSFHH